MTEWILLLLGVAAVCVLWVVISNARARLKIEAAFEKGILPMFHGVYAEERYLSFVRDQGLRMLEYDRHIRVHLVIMAKQRSVMAAAEMLFGLALKESIQQDKYDIDRSDAALLSYAGMFNRYRSFLEHLPELTRDEQEHTLLRICESFPPGSLERIEKLANSTEADELMRRTFG